MVYCRLAKLIQHVKSLSAVQEACPLVWNSLGAWEKRTSQLGERDSTWGKKAGNWTTMRASCPREQGRSSALCKWESRYLHVGAGWETSRGREQFAGVDRPGVLAVQACVLAVNKKRARWAGYCACKRKKKMGPCRGYNWPCREDDHWALSLAHFLWWWAWTFLLDLETWPLLWAAGLQSGPQFGPKWKGPIGLVGFKWALGPIKRKIKNNSNNGKIKKWDDI